MPQEDGEPVGADRVRLRDASLIIDSRADMPDWEFRAYRRLAILFRERRYFVAEKRLLPDGSYRYVLQPWEDSVGVPGRTITYDEGYAVGRDAALRTGVRRDRISKALFLVSPLLGFLPARTKLVLDDRYGFDPQAVTQQSLFIQRFAFYGLVAFFVIGGLAGVLGRWEWPVLIFTVAVFADLILRTSPSENGEAQQPGFWEWAIPGWKRRAKEAARRM